MLFKPQAPGQSYVVKSDQEFGMDRQNAIAAALRAISSGTAADGATESAANAQKSFIDQVMEQSGLNKDQVSAWIGMNAGTNANWAGYGVNDQWSQFGSQPFNNPENWYNEVPQARDGAYANLAATTAWWDTAAQERKRQQALEQQSYQQMQGGSQLGGIINDAYAQPYANQITGFSDPSATSFTDGGNNPGMPTTTMPWAQPWGTPGFGGPGSGPSVNQYSPTPGQQKPGGLGGLGGWGGPFGQKNPFSPT